MLLGLDFDNTLANYNSVFLELAKHSQLIDDNWKGDKKELRDYLRTLPDGEYLWQKLQGKVYGKWMHKAKLFDGVKDFLLECKGNNIPIVIVSHKTVYGIHDEDKILLREEAWNWLKNNDFFDVLGIKPERVYFESTKEEKIRRIASLGCTHYIDDLLEILIHQNFPQNTKKILFSKDADNNQMNDIYHFDDWKTLELKSIV